MDRLKTAAAGALQAPAFEPPGTAPLLPSLSEQPTVQERMARIVRTIEADIIPRLVRAHRPVGESVPVVEPPPLDADCVQRFVSQVLADDEGAYLQDLLVWRQQGVSVEVLYLDLLAPAARLLGQLWEDDRVLFSDVTVAVGRLQRLLRSMSPAFGLEIDCPPDGRRVLLVPVPGEQHTFGLSMVAEFFRRAGWDVVCDLDGQAVDAATLVRQEWFDVIGLSAGVDLRVGWLQSGITAIRTCSRNRAIGVMVGGPVFAVDPGLATRVGADACAVDGREAPRLAERLLHERVRRL